MLGEWVNNIHELREAFTAAQPYEHVIIPSFFNDEFASIISEDFPDPFDTGHDWKLYHNPLEYKWALNNFETTPRLARVYDFLQSTQMVDLLKSVTGMDNLESDPHLHGAGLHASPKGGKNDLHLDYVIHPLTGKQRKLNLIVYMNADWNADWGGALELWDANLENCVKKVSPDYNTAIIFHTGAKSYHGIPRPMTCPDGVLRKSLTNYYVTDLSPDAERRYKAEFFSHPDQDSDARLAHLRNIRKNRIIKQEDLDKWPTWRADGNGWWV